MARGRPPKLTPQVQDKILTAIRAGNYFDAACGYAGIGKGVGNEWLARGKGDHPRGKTKLFADFAEQVERARAESEAHAVAVIRNAMPTSWQAAAWWLERTNPKKFGRKFQLAEETEGGAKIDSAALLAKLKRLAGEDTP